MHNLSSPDYEQYINVLGAVTQKVAINLYFRITEEELIKYIMSGYFY